LLLLLWLTERCRNGTSWRWRSGRCRDSSSQML